MITTREKSARGGGHILLNIRTYLTKNNTRGRRAVLVEILVVLGVLTLTVVSAQYEQSTLRERTNTSEDKLKVEKNTNIETVSWFLANIYFKSHIDRQSPTAKYKI